ncbi:MAG: preprotein translocase subunit SecG [Steroidobacteraceae bacterium]
MLRTTLTILQFLVSAAIIALVLIQRGKGAEAGAGFGAGASGTVFGARGARTGLSRITAILAAVFIINSLVLAYMGSRKTDQPTSILDQAAAVTEQAPAAATVPAAQDAPASVIDDSVPAPATEDSATQQVPAPPNP